MMTQEKPTSEMVDDAFESLRTYRCWLDYLCETVTYSGLQDSGAREIRLPALDKLPGCMVPFNIEIIADGKPVTTLKYLPECNVEKNESTMKLIQTNLDICHNRVGREFGEIPAGGSTAQAAEISSNTSSAYIALESTLKKNSAEQSVRPVAEKLQTILDKMGGMVDGMTLLKEQLLQFDKRLPCYIKKCD
jgi:hypothetical protein